MEKILIRKASPADIHQIAGLCHEHARFEGGETGECFSAGTLSEHIFNCHSVQCVVVEQGEEIVGYATFMQQFSTWGADYYLYLDCLYLKEKLRGKGIGRTLMEEVRWYAQRHDCRFIQWQTPSFNEAAIKFYGSLGAKSYSKERFIWKIE